MMASRAFQTELNHMINLEVIVELRNGQKVKGVLKAISPDNLTLVLGDVYLGGDHYDSIVFSGHFISAIYVKRARLDLDELRIMLERVFPRMVSYRRDEGVIIVMNRVKVTESGVEGERGPVYDRVKKIYDEFLSKKKAL